MNIIKAVLCGDMKRSVEGGKKERIYGCSNKKEIAQCNVCPLKECVGIDSIKCPARRKNEDTGTD